MNQIHDWFRRAHSSVDVDGICREWLALGPDYNVDQWVLPLPPWRHRQFEHDGETAWKILQSDLFDGETAGAMCIYFHVPFCSSKCGFCDSYSFKLGSQRDKHIERYIDRLCVEMRLWSAQGDLRRRPISSVHLGGGTPTHLGESALVRLVECCRECFSISPATEWALEATVESLTSSMMVTMHELGFRRLHIGVQSMEDAVRTIIGRRRNSTDVLERIGMAMELGWITSVDLLCGLPLQSVEGFIAGIESLIAAQVDGFSLYELLVRPQNSRWAERNRIRQQDHLQNYCLFLAGAGLLEQRGYRKNLFNHWANSRDENIYFTFPARKEDLLAIGSLADGVFGRYHYRHPEYAQYLQRVCPRKPGLWAGLRRNAKEEQLHIFNTQLLSGALTQSRAADFALLRKSGGGRLIDSWISNGLLRAGNEKGRLELTSSGSWFAGNMTQDVSAGLDAHSP